jgi:uncharacterized protein YbaP (TraB family)
MMRFNRQSSHSVSLFLSEICTSGKDFFIRKTKAPHGGTSYCLLQSLRRSTMSFGLLSLCLQLLTLVSCHVTKAPSAKPLEKALLWEITGAGIKQPSYVYGTIHLIEADKYFLPSGTMSAMESCEKVVFEIDMKEMSDFSSLLGLMGKIYMQNNVTLKDLVTAEDYELISRHFQKIGMPMFLLDRMKPMFLSVFTYGDMDPSGIQNGRMKSYEMEFLTLANSLKKETGGLETVDFQLSLFDEIPYEAQAKMLVEGIRSQDKPEAGSLKVMSDMYTSQDIEAMAALISSEGKEVSEFEDKLVTKRNQNWVEPIIQSARKGPTFFAVGAGHLGGQSGLIRLLQKAGCKVRPVLKTSS